MKNFEYVNSTNIKYIANYNNKSKNFNPLNRSYILEYNEKNFLGKLILRNKCVLLKEDNALLGFIWASSFKESRCSINELYIDDAVGISRLPNIVTLFNPYSNVSYSSIKNEKTDIAINALGFSKKRAVTTMLLDRTSYKFDLSINIENITIKFFKEGEDEHIRCKIQNDIFRSSSRKDLLVQDILADERQGYYIKKGALFIKKNNVYVGYAQIIWNDGCITIVNLGVIPEYRSQGLGEILLKEILNLSIILFPDEKKFKIEVFDNNIPAISLYKKLGFKIQSTINYWEIPKKI